MLQLSYNLPTLMIRTIVVTCILAIFDQVISQETDSLIDSNALHESQVIQPDSSARDSARLDSIALAVSNSAKELLRVNDSLAQIDSLKKLALSQQLQKLKPKDTLKYKVIKVKIDSLYLSDSLRRRRQAIEIEKLRNKLTEYPVILENDSLFTIYVKVGSFTAKERAQAISNRLKKLVKLKHFKKDSLVIVPLESSYDILYGETTIMSITERDALWYNASTDSLSRRFSTILKNSITAYQKKHATLTYIIQGFEIVGVLLFSALLVFLVRKLFLKATTYISLHNEKLNIKNVPLLTKEMHRYLTFKLMRILKLIAYIVIGYITLPMLFNVFPWTRSLSNLLIDWALSPVKRIGIAIFHYLPNIFNIAIIIFLTQLLIRIFKKIFTEIEKGSLKFQGFYTDWARPTFNIIRFLLYVFMFIVV
ncbi:MAG: hypothetical protein JW795_18980, partial [Chitinivibrionales bacterium]|nr:hypothetical protein [Chitinivibrionales bacterium]